MSICLVFLPPAFSCLPDLLSVLFLTDPPLSLFSSNCSLLSGCPTLILLSFRLISYFSNRPRPLPFLICSSHFLLSPIHNATFIFLIFPSFHFPFIFSVPISIHPSGPHGISLFSFLMAPHCIFHPSTFPTYF